MNSVDSGEQKDPKERAKAVLLKVVHRSDFRRDHPTISAVVTDDIVEDAVEAAYRTQFDESRAHFRQKIAALGEVVAQEFRPKGE
ncbi:metal-dependent HD superfamily phosphatase/phosphodiesterase [Cellulomonas humilata]|uniref:Metal-dependent HD superfamily phosphatase/phosphodiesterase n=2 Tax=Cellulomonas humilata TaxID=144055 RepID=A0ABU0EL03_9CELL|nr:metal-dependent HD superfamily phosphatase/phosphodiesterase [Cellulomonas humilata]